MSWATGDVDGDVNEMMASLENEAKVFEAIS